MANPFTNTTGSATIGTDEFSLVNASTTPASATTAAEIEAWIDFSAMAAGDQYRVRVMEVAGGGSQATAYEAFLTGAQPMLLALRPRRVAEGWDVRVKLIAGSARTVRWALRLDVGDRNALTLGAAALTSAAAAVWGAASEGAETFGDAVRLIGARLFGKATVQDGDGAYVFRDKADAKDRLVMARAGSARVTATRDGT